MTWTPESVLNAMVMENKMLDTETNKNPEQKFWEVEVEGNVVKIPYDKLETLPDDISIPLKENGEVVKKPLKEIRESKMRQDDYSRKMNEFTEKEKQYKSKIAEYENKSKNETISKSPREIYTDSGLNDKEILDAIAKAEQIDPFDDPKAYAQAHADLSKKLYKEIIRVNKEHNDFKSSQIQEKQKELEERQNSEVIKRDIELAKKKYSWITRKDDPDYDKVKVALLQQKLVEVDQEGAKINDKRPLVELADEVEKFLEKREEEKAQRLAKQKEDLKSKSGLTPAGGTVVPKVEQLTTEKAIEKYQVQNPFED